MSINDKVIPAALPPGAATEETMQEMVADQNTLAVSAESQAAARYANILAILEELRDRLPAQLGHIDAAQALAVVQSRDSPIASLPLLLAVDLGVVTGYSKHYLVGHAHDIPHAADDFSYVTLWEPKISYPFPAAGVAVEAVSSSALDTAAGTGARIASWDCLDSDFNPFKLTFTLNGTTAVTAQEVGAPLFFRRQAGRVESVGSTGRNQGNITLRVAGGGSPLGYIKAARGADATGIYTVPASYIGQIACTSTAASSSSTTQDRRADFRLVCRAPGADQPWRTIQEWDGVSGQWRETEIAEGPIVAGTDLMLEGSASVVAGTTDINMLVCVLLGTPGGI